MSGQKRAKKWGFGDFEVPPDWKEGVKSKNCYDRSISRAKLPPCTNFQRKIRQNDIGYTLGFFCTIIYAIVQKSKLWKQVGRGSGSKFGCVLWDFTRLKMRNSI